MLSSIDKSKNSVGIFDSENSYSSTVNSAIGPEFSVIVSVMSQLKLSYAVTE